MRTSDNDVVNVTLPRTDNARQFLPSKCPNTLNFFAIRCDQLALSSGRALVLGRACVLGACGIFAVPTLIARMLCVLRCVLGEHRNLSHLTGGIHAKRERDLRRADPVRQGDQNHFSFDDGAWGGADVGAWARGRRASCLSSARGRRDGAWGGHNHVALVRGRRASCLSSARGRRASCTTPHYAASVAGVTALPLEYFKLIGRLCGFFFFFFFFFFLTEDKRGDLTT